LGLKLTNFYFHPAQQHGARALGLIYTIGFPGKFGSYHQDARRGASKNGTQDIGCTYLLLIIRAFLNLPAMFNGDNRMRSLLNRARRQCVLALVVGLLTAGAWGQNSASSPAPAPSPASAPSTTAAPSTQSSPEAPQPRQFTLKDYSKPRTHFPNLISPYRSRNVPEPVLSNTSRIDRMMQNGKLMLSIRDAIALALENNLDIAIARYNLNIADTDIMLANSGQATRGVNTGVVQGTPGGGVGGIGGTPTTGSQGGGAGGTTAGAGGAGTGTSGLVTSTLGVGSPVPSFDPIVTGTLQLDRSVTLSTSAFSAVPFATANSSIVNFAYQQGFHWGSTISVGFNNSRVTTNQPFSLLTPSLASNFRMTLTQPLLQGFGRLSNTRFITIAKNNREISDVAFRLQVITTVNQIQDIYWDLVNAYENVRVQEQSVALAQKTLSDNKKQVEIGTLAPIEIVRAQSVVATNQQALITAQTNLSLQQLLMKNALSRTLVDPQLADAEVIPTDTMQLPQQEEVMPIQDLVNAALGHRAELAESRIDLVNRDLTNKSAKNALLPSLGLFAYYGGSGLGGNLNPNTPLCTPSSTGFCVNPQDIPSSFHNGSSVSIGGTLGQLFDSTAPDKGVGLSLTIPLRNRAAQANQVRAELEYRQAQMRLQQLENQIRIEVRNAQFALQQNRAQVEATQAAVDLAKESLDAEQKKYALGASTNILVLQAQTSLTQAESNLLGAKAAYEKSRVELDRSTGLTLSHLGVEIADAERGQVTKDPTVPYVVPRAEVVPQSQAQPGTQPTPYQTQPLAQPAAPQAQPPAQPPIQEQPQPDQPKR
jgi:outer membrane protein